MKLTEFKIINKYLRSLTFNNKKSLKLKDDVYYDEKKKLVFSTDTYEEGVHFLNGKKPRNFVKKIFRASISDIICKGCIPTTYFLSLSLNNVNNFWIKNFKNELAKESKKFSLFLGGGDIIKSKKLTITLSVLGHVKNKPILRSNAKINDDIYITGNLGESYLGLLTVLKKLKSGKLKKYFKKSYEEPRLPYNFSFFLHKFASSAIDISDGLIKDLNSICTASKCGAFLKSENLPFSKKTKQLCLKRGIELFDIFSKGDDYQILFTSHKKNRKYISSSSKKTSTLVSRIGHITTGKKVNLTKEGNIVNFSSFNTGYIHKF
jgi:thiamine-monophosphate kinase